MYNFLVEKTTTYFSRVMNYEKGTEQYDQLWYGIYIFYINVLKNLLLIGIALWFGILQYVAVFFVAYGALRIYSFGFHLKSTIGCTLLGLLYYLGSTYISLQIGIPLPVRIGILSFGVIVFFLRSPVPSPERPIPDWQRPKFHKRSLMILSVVVLLSILLPEPFNNLLAMAILCQTINLLPFEKITRQNND